MDKQTFNEIFQSQKFTDHTVLKFEDRLREHGEVQVKTASGAVYSMHLGDWGLIEESEDAAFITLFAKDGQVHSICTREIEAINTHRGYLEN